MLLPPINSNIHLATPITRMQAQPHSLQSLREHRNRARFNFQETLPVFYLMSQIPHKIRIFAKTWTQMFLFCPLTEHHCRSLLSPLLIPRSSLLFAERPCSTSCVQDVGHALHREEELVGQADGKTIRKVPSSTGHAASSSSAAAKRLYAAAASSPNATARTIWHHWSGSSGWCFQDSLCWWRSRQLNWGEIDSCSLLGIWLIVSSLLRRSQVWSSMPHQAAPVQLASVNFAQLWFSHHHSSSTNTLCQACIKTHQTVLVVYTCLLGWAK